jgi:hypothetical protein
MAFFSHTLEEPWRFDLGVYSNSEWHSMFTLVQGRIDSVIEYRRERHLPSPVIDRPHLKALSNSPFNLGNKSNAFPLSIPSISDSPKHPLPFGAS